MKTSRRGLFGLGIGAALAALVGKGAKAEAQPIRPAFHDPMCYGNFHHGTPSRPTRCTCSLGHGEVIFGEAKVLPNRRFNIPRIETFRVRGADGKWLPDTIRWEVTFDDLSGVIDASG